MNLRETSEQKTKTSFDPPKPKRNFLPLPTQRLHLFSARPETSSAEGASAVKSVLLLGMALEATKAALDNKKTFKKHILIRPPKEFFLVGFM